MQVAGWHAPGFHPGPSTLTGASWGLARRRLTRSDGNRGGVGPIELDALEPIVGQLDR